MTIPLTKDGKPDKRYKPTPPKDLTVQDLPKLEQLIYYQYEGYPVKQAARAAGYAKNTIKTSLARIMRGEKYQQKCIEYAKAYELEDIPTILITERNIIHNTALDNSLYPTYKNIFKEKKQSVGLLQETGTHTQQINVNILTQVQSYQAGRAEDRLKELSDKAIDVTLKDDEE